MVSEEKHGRPERTTHMLSAIIVTILIIAALAYALGSGRRGGIILRRPYSNRYNDASGAREDACI
jgi:hypothetical protein